MAGIPDYSDDKWTELVERLSLHADAKLRKLLWRGLAMKSGGNPPGAVCAADLAADAIADWIDGKRHWNPEACPDVFVFLKGIVDSKVNHLAESVENAITRRLDVEHGRTGDGYRLRCPRPQPVEVVANKEQRDRFRAAMIAGIDGADLVAGVFECLEAEIDKPSEMADVLGVTVAEVNNAQKRLRRVAEKVCAKLGKARK